MMNILDLHRFWFGQIEICDTYYQHKVPLWFLGPHPEFDLACTQRFAPWLEQLAQTQNVFTTLCRACGAEQGTQRAAQVYLALVILFDQIPRNAFRASPQAFAYDVLAQQLCLAALDTEIESSLSYPERLFLYMPLEHAEDTDLQDLCVAKFESLHRHAPSAIVRWTQLALDKAHEHRNTILEHGRFPRRMRAA